MNEATPNNKILTSQVQGGYSKGGDIFMSEENIDAQKPPENNQGSAKKEEEEKKKQEPPKEPPIRREFQPDDEGEDGDAFSNRNSKKKELSRKQKLEIFEKKITEPKLIEIKNKLSARVPSSYESLSIPDQEQLGIDLVAEMAKAKEYLDKGSISQEQFDSLRDYCNTLQMAEGYEKSMEEIINLNERDDKEKAKKEEKLMELLRKTNPYSMNLPPELVAEIVKNRKALDYTVIRIIGQSLDSEESEYSQSFYGGMNLDIIKNALKTRGERGDPEARDNYHRVTTTADTAHELHSMNLRIITGKLDGFVEGSQNITPEKLEVMHNIKGVSEVIRLFDAEIFRLMNRDGMLKGSNYDEMMGFHKDQNSGKISWGEGTIEKKFRMMIEAKAVKGFSPKDDWEIKWALNVGKILGNISLRTSEQISLNKVQTGDYKMPSWPLEKSTRLFNWLGLTALRYGLGDVKAGIFLAKLTSHIYQEQRHENGYGDCRIKNIGWTSIDDFELAGLCGINGSFQGWRSQVILMNQARTAFTEKDTTEPQTVREAMMLTEKFWSKGDSSGGKLISKDDRIKELKPIKGEKLNQILQAEGARRLKEVFLRKVTRKDENGKDVEVFEMNEKGEKISVLELNTDYFSSNLGILLKSNPLNPSGKDTDDMWKAKELVRTAIWKNVAKDNPLAILPFLQGTTINLGKNDRAEIIEGEDAIRVIDKDGRSVEYKGAIPIRDDNKKIIGIGFDITAIDVRDKKVEEIYDADVRGIKGKYVVIKNENGKEEIKYKNENIKLIKDEEGKVVKISFDLSRKAKEGEADGAKEKWDKFADKLAILNELRMQTLKSGEYKSLENTINSKEGQVKDLTLLDEDERKWLEKIKIDGVLISQDLSNIRFPSIPFMNDTVFEKSDFSQAGKNYYGRRAGGDVGDFYKIGGAFAKIMTNPGGVAPKDVFDALHEVMTAIEGPLGTEFAQDRTRQFLEAYLIFIQKGGQLGVNLNDGTIKEGPQWDIARFLYRDNLLSGIKKGIRQPTSIAQVISGVNATSADESAMRDYLDKLLEISLTRKNVNDNNGIPQYLDLDKKFRKILKVGFLGMLAALFRDMPKIALIGMTAEFGKQITEEDK